LPLSSVERGRLVHNDGWVRTGIASLAICVAGGALLWRGTDGFRALTSEEARRRAIAASPRVVPVVELEDQDGRTFTLAHYRGRPVVVDFIYTGCGSVCPLLSDGFRRLYRAPVVVGDDARPLQLVSVTFDSLDTPARLREYASHYEADGDSWRFARVRSARDLATLLESFGVVVISDGRGGFQHNAAIHVVDERGRLTRVLDVGASPDDVVRAVAGPSR
jgi:protein SCO1/2